MVTTSYKTEFDSIPGGVFGLWYGQTPVLVFGRAWGVEGIECWLNSVVFFASSYM